MFSDPVKNLKVFGLREDSIVADLGAGTGFYSIHAGSMVPKGKVYAVEIVKEFLMTIKKKAEEARLDNIEILWGDIEKKGGTCIGSDATDLIIASNVLFQIEDKKEFVCESKRILKTKGRLLLIDWEEGFPGFSRKSPNVSKEEAQTLFEKEGFMLERHIDAGKHHYGMIFTKY